MTGVRTSSTTHASRKIAPHADSWAIEDSWNFFPLEIYLHLVNLINSPSWYIRRYARYNIYNKFTIYNKVLFPLIGEGDVPFLYLGAYGNYNELSRRSSKPASVKFNLIFHAILHFSFNTQPGSKDTAHKLWSNVTNSRK